MEPTKRLCEGVDPDDGTRCNEMVDTTKTQPEGGAYYCDDCHPMGNAKSD